MILPGCTPGPDQSPSSTTAAASQAARSAALLASRAATGAASRTASFRRALAARRKARASARMATSGAGAKPTGPVRGSRSTCIQRWPMTGIRYSKVVGSLRRDPMTSSASAAAIRSRTTFGLPNPAMPK